MDSRGNVLEVWEGEADNGAVSEDRESFDWWEFDVFEDVMECEGFVEVEDRRCTLVMAQQSHELHQRPLRQNVHEYQRG